MTRCDVKENIVLESTIKWCTSPNLLTAKKLVVRPTDVIPETEVQTELCWMLARKESRICN